MDIELMIEMNLIGILAILFLFFFFHREVKLNKRFISIFRSAAIMNLFLIVFDILQYLCSYASFSSAWIFTIFLEAICYVLNPTMPVIISRLFFDSKKSNKISYGILISNALLVFLFMGLSTGYHETNPSLAIIFSRTASYCQMAISGLVMIFILSLLIGGYLKDKRQRGNLFFALLLLILIGCVIIEALSSWRFLLWNMAALSLLVLYLYESNTNLHHDALTGLYNRLIFEKDLAVHSPSQLVFVFDINNLKETNDLHGHTAGDELIIQVVDGIKKTFADDGGKTYRIGGDEIVHISSYKNDEQTKKRISDLFDILGCDHLVAYGYASSKDGSSLQEAFSEADNNMYHCKSEMKKKYNLPTRK